MAMNKRALEASSEADMPCKQMKTATRRRSPQLPDDVLLIEVLTRLPAKSLCRFKLVNRLWRDTISTDRFFARLQSRCQTRISSGVVYRCPIRRSLAFLPTCEGGVGVPDPFLGFPDAKNFKIAACVHGLLLLCVDLASDQFLYILNPATGEGMRIPGRMRGDHLSRFGLIFNPRYSFGLAFDPWASPDRYIIVNAQSSLYYRYYFEIFSSSTGQWTASSAIATVYPKRKLDKAIFSEGVVYWHGGENILSYNTLDDAAQVIMVPPRASRDCTAADIGVWEKSLAYSRSSPEMVEVWVLRRETSKWEMKHRIQLDRVDLLCARLYHKLWWKWQVVMPGEGGKNIIYMRTKVNRKDGTLKPKEVIVRWDTELEEAAVLGDVAADWCAYPHAFSYHSSLVALPHFPQP